jgi:hypothetical protein
MFLVFGVTLFVVGFEIITVVSIKLAVLWGVTSLDKEHYIGDASCLYFTSTMKIEAADFYK